MRPVSGRNPLAGSSVVIRHCSAAPRGRIASWLRPRSASVSPAAMRSCAGDQVDVGDLLGDGVLDLDSRVHLDEDVLAALVEQELDGARAAVADLAGERDGVGADLSRAAPRIQVRRRRQLDHLLVAALHAAVALEEVDDVAVGVGQDLHLDVARVDHRLLEEHRRVAERRLRLAAGGLDRPRRSSAGSATRRMPRPPPPATALTNSGNVHVLRPRRPVRRPTPTAPRTPAPADRPPGPRRSPGTCCRSAPGRSAPGPTNVMPAAAHAAASSGFSERNP